jgi:hypothetical protein
MLARYYQISRLINFEFLVALGFRYAQGDGQVFSNLDRRTQAVPLDPPDRNTGAAHPPAQFRLGQAQEFPPFFDGLPKSYFLFHKVPYRG